LRLLALDTSGKAVSVAVAEDGRICARFWIEHGRTHAEALMPCVEATLTGLGAEAGDFDAYAAVTGPGSFTGLRIGVAAVKAMAYASGVGTVGVSTLETLAWNLRFREGALLCPIMDARNRKVYAAVYRAARGGSFCAEAAPAGGSGVVDGGGDEPVCLVGAEAVGVDELAERLRALLAENPELSGVLFNGDAARAYLEFFRGARAGLSCACADERDLLQDASSAAQIACRRAARGELTPPALLVPEYLHPGYAARAPGAL
jgi:tRNA threonylcarbamoyladenosine biosynthesis protein TsaB